MTSHEVPSCVQDERTPLLHGQHQIAIDERNRDSINTSKSNTSKSHRTPLPRVQVAILSLVQLVTPVASQSIYPYINQLIRELDITHGDERRVGYYAGFIESLFFVTQALTTLSWSRLSDHIGRKPVILIGLSGLCISMLCFGLSRTFITLVLSRCICGALDGNSGVMKSMLGELTDASNMAQGFSLLPIVWCVGATVGPFIGGILARPADRWPRLFADQFWHDNPYFLPCVAVSSFTAFAMLLIAFFLKETLPRRKVKTASPENPEDLHHPTSEPAVPDVPLPMRDLLISSVLIPIANHGLLSLADAAYFALLPLFYSTPPTSGGLGFSPAMIGTVLGTLGLIDGVLQALFFAPIVNRMGAKRTFRFATACYLPMFVTFPIMSLVVSQRGVDAVVWGLLVLQLAFQVIRDMSFGCIMMHITASAPSKRSLGSVNGLSQTLSATARALGPAMATSLFAASKEYNLLGGNVVYVVMVFLTVCLMCMGSRLPDEIVKLTDSVLRK